MTIRKLIQLFDKDMLNVKRGFTLIELMVVISIISLLSSVVLVSLQDARDKAKIATFKEDIRQTLLAIELYKSNNGGALPTDYGTQVKGIYIPKWPEIPFKEGSPLLYVGNYDVNGGSDFDYLYLVSEFNDPIESLNPKYAELLNMGWYSDDYGYIYDLTP